jgi:exosome complex component RRP42
MIEIDADLIKSMAERGKRIDNRGFDQYREIVIEHNVIPSAEGSCRVRIGHTEVIAGVKIDVGEPFADTPDEGVLMVNTEFVPLASPDFEPGPPGEDSIEVARVVDRAIRESKSIDFSKLCISPKEKVWMVYVDIDVLDNDGNLIDAAGLAAAAALRNATMPVLTEDRRVDYGKKTGEKLPINYTPVSVTVCKIGKSIMTDPSLSETNAIDARLTVGTIEKDGETYLSSMQKGGPSGLTVEEIERMVDLAKDKGNELRRLIE